MSITITKDAAEYILKFLAAQGKTQPVRLILENVRGCGDKNFRFVPGASKGVDDTEHTEHGLTLLCNFNEFPDLLGISIEQEVKNLLPQLKIDIPALQSCGCGASYAPRQK